MITDAQVHLFEADSPEHPWPRDPGRGAPRVPSFTAERMIGAMDAIGVDRAVIVPPVWAGDTNDTAVAAAKAFPGRFAIMGRLDPFAPGSAEELETWFDQPDMLGIRMSGRWGTRPEQFPQILAEGSLDWFWSACERLEIPIAFLTRESLKFMEPVATANPNLRIIIDHLGTVDAESVDASFVHVEELLALARYPNVNVKVSTAPNHSHQKYPFEDVQPILRRVHNAYGASRLLWAYGSTPPTKSTYAENLRLWQEGLPFLSADDIERILGRTAAEVLRWPETK